MATIEQKFFKHMIKDPLIHQCKNVMNRVMQLPICPKCERVALRDTRKGDPERRFITCPVCGYHGRFTHTAKVHMQEHVPNTYTVPRPDRRPHSLGRR